MRTRKHVESTGNSIGTQRKRSKKHLFLWPPMPHVGGGGHWHVPRTCREIGRPVTSLLRAIRAVAISACSQYTNLVSSQMSFLRRAPQLWIERSFRSSTYMATNYGILPLNIDVLFELL
jgi:hypothetical protein